MNYSTDSDVVDMTPPPIVTYDIDTDDNAVKEGLKRMLKHEFSVRRQKDAMYFYTQSKEDYGTLIKFLQFYNHGYYTYLPPWHNTQLIVLKNYLGDEKSIVDHLKAKGIKCLGVHIINRRPTEVDSPAMLLTLPRSTNLDRLMRFKYLGNIGGISWEEYSVDRYTPLQCHRCQRFKHDSRFCYMPPNCNACGEEHLSKDCKNKKKAWKCFNCKGDHPADDADCPKWIAYKERLMKARTRAEREEKNEQSRAVFSCPASTREAIESINMSFSEILKTLEEFSNLTSKLS